jgi:hypothetical protein
MIQSLFLDFFRHITVVVIFMVACASPSQIEALSSIVIPNRIDSNVNLASLISSIEKIQLETNENALLGLIKDVILYNNKFYINDGNQILVFDKNGNFLFKLGKKGDGPGEYKFINSMTIDFKSNLIYISSNKKLIVFSSDHKLSNEKIFNMPLSYINFANNKLLIISDEIVGNFEHGFISNTILYELGGGLLINDTSIIRSVIIDENRTADFKFKFLVSNNQFGNFFYKPVLNQKSVFPDTLYQINGVRLTPYKKILFEKTQEINSNGRISPLMLNIVNSTSYLICEYIHDYERMLFLYDKTKSKEYNLKEGIIDDEGDPVILRPLDLGNDVFYYIKSSEYSDSANEEMNPIIGIVKLKFKLGDYDGKNN